MTSEVVNTQPNNCTLYELEDNLAAFVHTVDLAPDEPTRQLVLDEIGRGTSTYDGLAIAWSVAEYLHDAIACRAMFATHYHELAELASSRAPTCESWSVSAREHGGDIVFLHRLQRGAASRSYGIACARLAGVPEPVLARARVLLSNLERGPLRRDPPSTENRAQLGLFEATQAASASSPHPALEALRATDVDRLTPLEALTLVAGLKKMAT